MIKIHDVDRGFLKSLDLALKEFNIIPNLSYLELAFDFYSNDRKRVQEFLVNHLFLKNQRTVSGWKKTTFYANDGRKSSKGLTVYLKLDKPLVTRLELKLHNQLLKKLQIKFPLNSIDSLDFFKFFSFKEINEQYLKKYLVWYNRKQIEEINQRRPGYSSLFIRQIESWLRSNLDDARSLMKKVEILRSRRGVPNYSRFVEPFDQLNNEFMKQVAGQKFVKNLTHI